MPFIELERAKNSPLDNEITITTLGRIYLARNLMKHFPSGTLRAFIDKESNKIGLQDSGPINLRYNYSGNNIIVANIPDLKNYRIKLQRYLAKWSKKHQMVIVEIEFNV